MNLILLVNTSMKYINLILFIVIDINNEVY